MVVHLFEYIISQFLCAGLVSPTPLIPSFSFHISLQPTEPAPSWHPGGSDSPASLRERGGEREGWEGREEEGMNQNTIKGTGWPFWELKARWLEAASHRQWRERDRKSGWSKRPMRPFISKERAITLQPLLAAKQGVLIETHSRSKTT